MLAGIELVFFTPELLIGGKWWRRMLSGTTYTLRVDEPTVRLNGITMCTLWTNTYKQG